MSLRAVNLNLVPILRALLREQHVSRAAASLSLTQPAVSAALAHLRELLHDPLLVPAGRGLELTPRAKSMVQSVEQVCDALEGLWRDPDFDPATAQRCFVIASADYPPLLIGPAMLRRLAQSAPGISIQFRDVPLPAAFGKQAGEIDFVITTRFGLTSQGIKDVPTLPLFEDDFVLVVGGQHKLAAQPVITLADLAGQTLLTFDPGLDPLPGSATGPFEAPYAGAQLGLRVQQFAALRLLPTLVDCVALVPRRLVDLPGGVAPVRVVGPPQTPMRVELCLAWSPRHTNDPAHRWFRELLLAEMRP